MRGGTHGLLLAILLMIAVSIGLSLPAGGASEAAIDACLVGAVALAAAAWTLSARGAAVAAVSAAALLGVAWGGHAATREPLGCIRSRVGADPALIRFRAVLSERFHQPELPEDDLLDRFQQPGEAPRWRAQAQMQCVISRGGSWPCAGAVTLIIEGDGSDLCTGDTVDGVGWLRRIRVPQNPGEPDARPRAAQASLAATVSVAGSPQRMREGGGIAGPMRDRAQAWVDGHLLAAIHAAPQPVRALVVAMTTGRRLPGFSSVRRIFTDAGLTHFIAISGFNLAVLFAAVWVLLELLRVPWMARGWLLAATAGAFLHVVDVETSVLRAGVAGLMVGASVALDRGWRADGMLGAAALFTMACDPWSAWNPGFQLSYGAVLALRHGSGPVLRLLSAPRAAVSERVARAVRRVSWLIEILATGLAASVAAWLVSAPVTATHFGSVSAWAAPASVVLAPLAAAITVLASLACLLGSLPGADIVLGWPLTLTADLFLRLTRWVGELPVANIRSQPLPWWWAVGLLLLLASCWTSPAAWVRRTCGGAFVLLLIVGLMRPEQPVGEAPRGWLLRMTSISVGNGSAHLIETPRSRVLFDAGTISRRAGGSTMIVPALRAIGCRALDAVVISHPHLDHFSALPEIVEAMPVERVYSTEAFVHGAAASPDGAPGVLVDFLKQRGVNVAILVAGSRLQWDGFAWTALHPPREYRPRLVNDGSLAFAVSPLRPAPSRDASLDDAPRDDSRHDEALSDGSPPDNSPRDASRAWLMLCGDAQTEAMARILASPLFTPAMVMEIPHHGAWSDGVGELLSRCGAEALVQSTGMQRFRHNRIGPLLERRACGVTCRDGALRVSWLGRRDADGAPVIERILLERWSGQSWTELATRTIH
jgi:competence protein ComEC